VALSAVRVDADESLRSLDPKSERNCLFEDEVKSLKFHKRYSQANCFLECSLKNAQDQLRKLNNQSCTPWYFPISSENSVICDPWDANNILQWMQISNQKCPQCLSGKTILEALYLPYLLFKIV
jgi:hypothetical protein